MDDPRIDAMLAVSRAVVRRGPPSEALDEIARHASTLVSARAASILELAGERFRIVGSHGLSAEYRRLLDDWPMPLAPGRGPAGLAVRRGAPVLIEQVEGDPVLADYADLARREGYRSIASFPLAVDGSVLGTLTIYRTAAGPWTGEDVRMLGFFAEHAANAVATAQLLAEERRQVAALERMVLRLREQTHEHANRLHALAGLLALGEADEALALVAELSEAHVTDRERFADMPGNRALAGLLWVETVLARQRQIELELEIGDGVGRLPLTDAQALIIVGNLLDNALDAVADQPAPRRRVRISISAAGGRFRIRVRDWGSGLDGGPDPFAHGTSTKRDHVGVGLALVAETVQAVRGRVAVEHHSEGVAVVVTLPAKAEVRTVITGLPPRSAP